MAFAHFWEDAPSLSLPQRSLQVEKAAKKPKVEDPVDAAITKLSNAINFDLAAELPHKAVTMVRSCAERR